MWNFGYQAPEQVSGDPTTRSDLYSVGVIAVELFTKSPDNIVDASWVLEWQRKCMDLPTKWYRWLDGCWMDPKIDLHHRRSFQNMRIDIEVEKTHQSSERWRCSDVPTTGDFLFKAEAKNNG